MRRSRQVILVITVIASMAIAIFMQWSSPGKGDDEAQPRVRVFVGNETALAGFRRFPSTTSTTTTVPPTTTTTTTVPVQNTSQTFKPIEVEYGTGACGGDLPPCWVMMRESRGDIRAKNPSSSASGKWQILDSTWQLHDAQGNALPFMGYWHASDAPEWVQDAKARSMALCNWEPPNYCAG